MDGRKTTSQSLTLAYQDSVCKRRVNQVRCRVQRLRKCDFFNIGGWQRQPRSRLPLPYFNKLMQVLLCSAATTGGQFPNMIQEDGALQGVQLRCVGGDFGEERIRHENGGLVAMAGVRVAKQGGDVDLQGFGEPIQ